jgi:hypothetical protein
MSPRLFQAPPAPGFRDMTGSLALNGNLRYWHMGPSFYMENGNEWDPILTSIQFAWPVTTATIVPDDDGIHFYAVGNRVAKINGITGQVLWARTASVSFLNHAVFARGNLWLAGGSTLSVLIKVTPQGVVSRLILNGKAFCHVPGSFATTSPSWITLDDRGKVWVALDYGESGGRGGTAIVDANSMQYETTIAYNSHVSFFRDGQVWMQQNRFFQLCTAPFSYSALRPNGGNPLYEYFGVDPATKQQTGQYRLDRTSAAFQGPGVGTDGNATIPLSLLQTNPSVDVYQDASTVYYLKEGSSYSSNGAVSVAWEQDWFGSRVTGTTYVPGCRAASFGRWNVPNTPGGLYITGWGLFGGVSYYSVVHALLPRTIRGIQAPGVFTLLPYVGGGDQAAQLARIGGIYAFNGAGGPGTLEGQPQRNPPEAYGIAKSLSLYYQSPYDDGGGPGQLGIEYAGWAIPIGTFASNWVMGNAASVGNKLWLSPGPVAWDETSFYPYWRSGGRGIGMPYYFENFTTLGWHRTHLNVITLEPLFNPFSIFGVNSGGHRTQPRQLPQDSETWVDPTRRSF